MIALGNDIRTVIILGVIWVLVFGEGVRWVQRRVSKQQTRTTKTQKWPTTSYKEKP